MNTTKFSGDLDIGVKENNNSHIFVGNKQELSMQQNFQSAVTVNNEINVILVHEKNESLNSQ
jgi:hypothetical protein